MPSSGPQVLGPVSTFTVNGTDISDFVTNVTIEDSREEVDVTGFTQDTRSFIPGLRDASINATILQGYGSNEPDAVLGNLYYNNLAGTVKVNPDTNGTVVYTMISKIYSFSPVSGAVGDRNEIEVTFRNFGTAGITRGTS